MPAKLAHANEITLGRRRRWVNDLAGGACLTKQKPDRLIDGGLGSETLWPWRRFRRPDAAKVGEATRRAIRPCSGARRP
jgi:hypothetical protein